jgi:ribonuclease E
VELTRKRQGQNIYELFGQICPSCGGLGHLVRLPGEPDRQVKEIMEPAAVPVASFRESRIQDIPEPLDIGPNDDADDIDFVNHPSYQERGGLNNNRRRRRSRLNEPLAREETITKGSQRPTPVIQLKSESLADADSFNPGLSDSIQATPLAKRTIIPPEDLGIAARNPILEPVERVGKPQLIKSPRETEPPEVIAIEMTSEEQDVYALMGISPLVRLNREVRNPKSVVLSVVLPGEAKPVESSTDSEAESFSETPSYSLESEEPESLEMLSVTSPVFTPETNEPRTITTPMPSSTESPTPDTLMDLFRNDSFENGSESGSSVIRRRRRRSSAIDNEDSAAE